MDWSDCDLVESVPGKVSGASLIVGTRIFADSIPENYEAFLDEGATPEQAVNETLECFPGARVERIQALLSYYYSHQPQPQP